jgi:hypothetical protein
MKHKQCAILALAFLGAAWSAGAQSLTVVAPNGGERWTAETGQTIAWTLVRVTGNVRIILLDEAGTRVGLIATVPAADGRFSWTVGRLTTGTAPAGRRYLVRLFAPNEDVEDLSDAAFTILAGAAPPAPRIEVTEPASGASWYIGRTYTLAWRPSGTMPASVSIDLRRQGSADAEPSAWDVADHTDNDGSFITAAVPASVPSGRYFIRVSTIGGAVTGDSGAFSINSLLQARTPTVVAQPVGLIRTLTMPVNFRTSWKYRERHQWNCLATMGLGPGDVPPNEFKVGFFNRCADRGACADECVATVYRGSPVWDTARLHPLAGKTIVKATLSIRLKGTEADPPCGFCLKHIYWYSGLMGEANPAPVISPPLPTVLSGDYRIDVTEMMQNWLREEAPGYRGEQHNYRMEFVGLNERQEFNNQKCVSTFDNGVLEIQYRD